MSTTHHNLYESGMKQGRIALLYHTGHDSTKETSASPRSVDAIEWRRTPEFVTDKRFRKEWSNFVFSNSSEISDESSDGYLRLHNKYKRFVHQYLNKVADKIYDDGEYVFLRAVKCFPTFKLMVEREHQAFMEIWLGAEFD